MAGGHTINWIWIRHAPATLHGRFCGHSDPALDDGNVRGYRAVARTLPKDCLTFSSPLLRARQTLERLVGAGFSPGSIVSSAEITEQNFGSLDGKPYADVELPQDANALAAWRPEHGESFTDVCARVSRFVAEIRLGRPENVCLVSHAGAIRAALTLAHGLSPAEGLALPVAPLSLTHLSLSQDGDWDILTSNRILEGA
ncbi:MAG: histidine phosphatase family protein [Rhizomicrobium sp.]